MSDTTNATGTGGEQIQTKNIHATGSPATDAVAEKIGIKNIHATGTNPAPAPTAPEAGTGDASTDNIHATTEPAK
ncbi:hypothetical protein [Streptomyces purpureus]|uniref:Uncharacterized protein n=1 Tax=Streptomyces purpureus TaxID=1951 RepID=A0A918H3U2_9ACTN|nr:hypothetical protein [Streptomyces purpureus]GGT36064.1 hypothetical protein GCM10014713_32070 [Streptomyces purpureus]